jgi:uncharacterized membrane protein (DUF106 family)
MDQDEFKKKYILNVNKPQKMNSMSNSVKMMQNMKVNTKTLQSNKVNRDLKKYYKIKEDMKNMKIEFMKMNGKPVQQILNETIGRTF